MGNRFTKFKSNYIMRSRHQRTDLGTIMERDWVTTNGLNVLRFGAGRRIWYNSGNFVFTTSNIPTYHKKHRLTTETKEWKWDDCKSSDGTVNDVKPNLFTNDLRDYAYYGSCVELVRATVEEIIMDFPGRLVTDETFELNNSLRILKNDFNIDLHHSSVKLGEYDNPMRFISETYDKYCIIYNNGKSENIISVSVGEWKGDLECPRNDEGKNVVDIIIKTEENSDNGYKIYCYSVNNEIVYTVKKQDNLIIQPKKEYIDDYFSKLEGLKKQLLRQDTNPYYSNDFKTPIEFNFQWYYPEKRYIWPSYGYCIDISSMMFLNFYNRLIDAAQIFDELWTDNLYRSMTHESIKNFDWTYSREYYQGEEQDNIDGGERMQKIIRVFGRVFDDVKLYIDSIKNINNITYDKLKNMPEALVSDAVDLKGLDVISTIYTDKSVYDFDTNITSEYLKKITKEENSTLKTWYNTINPTDIYADICDNEIMRRILLSVKRIMQTKGTQQSIEMMLGIFGLGIGNDYSIQEEAFYTEKLIPYNECVNGDGGVEDFISKTKNVDWTEVNSNVKGDLANEINMAKDLDILYYNDPFSGIPLRTVFLGINNTPYIVPYYDSSLIYDGGLIFQGKGGWGKFVRDGDIDATDDSFDYQETLSYLHVVGTIEDLLNVNPLTVQKNDIYYVTNLSNYVEYDEILVSKINGSITVSHYFTLLNDYQPHKFNSWRNIIVKNELDENGNIQFVEEEEFKTIYGGYWDYKGNTESYLFSFKHMKYLESIFSTNVANNPHVGYGNYDDGNEFIEYMKKPFKYLIDNNLIANSSLSNLANKFIFDDIENNKIYDKIQIVESKPNNWINYNTNTTNTYPKVEKVWYINTKILTITNNNNNSLYKKYFRNVIMPYLMQVIPSTTILKLKNFD